MALVQSATYDQPLAGFPSWLSGQLAGVALEKAHQIYGSGDLPVMYVDGRKNKPLAAVKPFGNVLFAPQIGPVAEAAALAWAFVQAAAPVRSGHYSGSFLWYANGRPASASGPPDVARLGRKGNVQLVDLAPYATIVEIQVPRGVLYGAYLAVRRQFGRRVSVSFGYKRPGGKYQPNAGGPYADSGRTYPLNVPVLEIGSPASNVKNTAKRPGAYSRRKARRKGRL